MSHPPAILDYASPRAPAGAGARLPARSELHVTVGGEGIRVIETLTGKAGAVAALAFAACMLAMLLVPIRDRRSAVGARVLAAALWVVEAALMPAVVNSTWRRTELSADRAWLRLAFHAPLWGRRRYEWPAERVVSVEVNATWSRPVAAPDESSPRVGSMLLLLTIRDARPVALFAGHDPRQLDAIAGAINAALGTQP